MALTKQLPAQQLEEMMTGFDPSIVAIAKGAIIRLRKLLPGAVEMVYDNAYSLVVGFGATDRASEAVVSVAMFPKKVALCFIWGVHLPDPGKLLRGSGNQVRNLLLTAPADLDAKYAKDFVIAARERSDQPFPGGRGVMQIRAVSANKRERTPAVRQATSRTRPARASAKAAGGAKPKSKPRSKATPRRRAKA